MWGTNYPPRQNEVTCKEDRWDGWDWTLFGYCNLDGCSPKHFWIYCITTRTFFVHCVLEFKWLFLTMRNDHWECSEPKWLELIVYILSLAHCCQWEFIGVSELRKESCLRWKHLEINPKINTYVLIYVPWP